MHNHLGKQLVIRDSKSADLTPMIKLLSGSPCVHAVRNYVTQQYMICTKYNSVYTVISIYPSRQWLGHT